MTRLATVALTVMAFPCLVCADQLQFRVVSKIFVGDNNQAVSETITLFDSGVAYELPQGENDHLITVYDPASKQVILINRIKNTQTVISTDALVKTSVSVRAAARTPEQKSRLGISAKVKSNSDGSSFSVEHGPWKYEIETQPTSPQMANDYARYADLAKRLNLAQRIHGPPPFGRMKLNEAIQQASKIPKQTDLTITDQNHTHRFQSTLGLSNSITDADRKQIKLVGSMLEVFRTIPFDEFE